MTVQHAQSWKINRISNHSPSTILGGETSSISEWWVHHVEVLWCLLDSRVNIWPAEEPISLADDEHFVIMLRALLAVPGSVSVGAYEPYGRDGRLEPYSRR